jgi:hypothetical protein
MIMRRHREKWRLTLPGLKSKPKRREWRSARVSGQETRKFGYLVGACGGWMDTRGRRMVG